MNCCLCQKRLATDKRKRRKLHGPSCSSLKEELQKLSSVSLESLETLSDRDAYLCSTCEFQLKSKHKGKDISQILAVVSQLPSSFVWQLLKFLFWMKILQD